MSLRPYLITLAQLRAHPRPAPWWAAHRLAPAVLVQSPSLFRAEDAPKLDPTIRDIASLAPAGFYVAAWCFEAGEPGPLTKLPPPAWSAFLGNVARLGASLHAHGGAGLVVDCEYYPATPGSSGGPMALGAWSGPDAAARGAALGHALGHGLTLGAMVWAKEFQRQPGLALFWRAAWHAVGPAHALLFAEDYVGRGSVKLIEGLGGRYLSGGWVKQANALPRGEWLWDPGAVMVVDGPHAAGEP